MQVTGGGGGAGGGDLERIILTPKNIQALRTLFNVAHRLATSLGGAWFLILETMNALAGSATHPSPPPKLQAASLKRLSPPMSDRIFTTCIISQLSRLSYVERIHK